MSIHALIRKIWNNKWVLRSILPTIYFNFHYLPFSQAVKLPILLYKPRLFRCKGRVRIVSDKVEPGMIKLGIYGVTIYPNNGIMFQNNGGVITFRGGCCIGNDSYISIGINGSLDFGANFNATAGLKIVAYHKIIFEDDVLVGWENMFVDNDGHQITATDKDMKLPKPYGIVHIGKGCWFAYGSYVMKNTKLHDYCIVAAKSMLNKNYDIPKYSLLAGMPATAKKTGVYLDKRYDFVKYPSLDNV